MPGNESKKDRQQPDVLETSSKMQEVMSEATNMDSRFDPNGSYTGRPLEPGEVPVQDADDL